MDVSWIRHELTARDRTQNELAAYLGVSEPTMSKILSGARRLKADEADKIRLFFGLPPEGALRDFEVEILSLARRLSDEQGRALAAHLKLFLRQD